VARNQTTQRQRTSKNPLNLGSFSQTSLRYLRGTLGPVSQVVGRADTWDTSNGGFGGGTYNHWFKITLLSSAWIITAKGPPRPNYIQVSAYDLNQKPIQERAIFGADSISETVQGEVYYPYVGHVMGAQSDLYNTFNPNRIDRGDDRYFVLPPGGYLLCISTTRNELLAYEVGLIIEIQDVDFELLLEPGGANKFIYENEISLDNTVAIGPTFSISLTLPSGVNGYTSILATINSGVTVTITLGSEWFISNAPPGVVTGPEEFIFLDTTENYTGEDVHLHSLGEWQTAWEREHQQDDRFPAVFLPLVTSL
jgi:hypothetical protein